MRGAVWGASQQRTNIAEGGCQWCVFQLLHGSWGEASEHVHLGDSLPAESPACLETARWYMTRCAGSGASFQTAARRSNNGAFHSLAQREWARLLLGHSRPALCTCQMCFDAGSWSGLNRHCDFSGKQMISKQMARAYLIKLMYSDCSVCVLRGALLWQF